MDDGACGWSVGSFVEADGFASPVCTGNCPLPRDVQLAFTLSL